MFQRILVPLDGSILAEKALAHARRFARVFDARLVLLHVLDASLFPENARITDPFTWQVRKAQAEMYLQSITAQVSETGQQVEYTLLEGKAAESIIDYAHSGNIDLLVITTHGASGLSRWNASSVTQKVLEKIYLPVLLVRAYPPAAHQEEPAALAEPPAAEPTFAGGTAVEGLPSTLGGEADYRRILLPIDTSRRAECALSPAVTLAREDTSLVLAAVIRPPEIPAPTPHPPEAAEIIERFLQVSREVVANYLEEQQRRIPARVVTHVAENENISAALHELAVQEDVDLVILCAHGQTGGMKWPYGSISRNYIEYGDRDVLIIQDVHRSQVRPTAVEAAARRYGSR